MYDFSQLINTQIVAPRLAFNDGFNRISEQYQLTQASQNRTDLRTNNIFI